MVGNGPLLCQSTALSLSEHCSDPKEDPCRVSHSLVSPPLRCLVSISPPSECCFFAASGSLSLLPRVPACVAVSLMSLATTGPVAQRQGSWVVGDHCSMAHRLLWTQHLSHLSDEMALHMRDVLAKTAPLCSEPAAGKSVHTQLSGEYGRGQAKTRQMRRILLTSAKLAWMWLWSMILACASARAFVQSLMERRGTPGHDGPMLVMRVSHDVHDVRPSVD